MRFVHYHRFYELLFLSKLKLYIYFFTLTFILFHSKVVKRKYYVTQWGGGWSAQISIKKVHDPTLLLISVTRGRGGCAEESVNEYLAIDSGGNVSE